MNGARDLRIERLELREFRSYGRFTLEPAEGLTVIVGPNASGKTNLLEAARLITSGASFRKPRWEDMVRHGAEAAEVRMQAAAEDGSRLDAVVTVRAAGRTFTANGKTVRRRAEMAKRLPSVVFTPDDLGLVKGPAEQRREAIDEIGESLSSAYGALAREYGRTLRQRNALLKDETASLAEMESWTERLGAVGGKLAAHRVSLIRRMAEHAEQVYAEIAGEETLCVRYEDSYGIGATRWQEEPSSEEIAASIVQRLRERAAEERRRLVTLAGPNRDDISFRVAGSEARTKASQGQQRTVALAWKIAELRVVQEVTGKRPVLLLDDVMSELDGRRRAALTRYVGEGMQTLVTATTIDYFQPELLDGALVVRTREEAGT